MPTEMTAAEIVAEAKALQAAVAESDLFVGRFNRVRDWEAWCRLHGPRLVALVEAAVEMREAQAFYFGRHSIESDADHGSTKLASAVERWDALASPAPVAPGSGEEK